MIEAAERSTLTASSLLLPVRLPNPTAVAIGLPLWLGGLKVIHVAKFRRSNRYWYVRYWIDGRAVDESAHTHNESAAESLRRRREIEINAGIQPLRHADLGSLIDQYLELLPPMMQFTTYVVASS